jgi:hypothetical protein
MGKTLVIAEKPSVGRDLSRVLPGPFQKHSGAGEKQERWLEGPEHIITWAIGHLVQLADPEAYDDKFKKWRMADLPIVPGRFKLVVRDERSQKQMSVVKTLLKREDVDVVVNACDAGREGELIFAYLFEQSGASRRKDLQVKRLWLSSMTSDAMRDALANLRDGADFAHLEEAARSRSEADWIVGMNATRAATIRLRSSFDGAVSLGRVQTPTLAIIARREEEIRAFVPEPYWLVDATFEAEGGRRYEGRFHKANQPRLATAEEADAVVAAVRGRRGTITSLEKRKRTEIAPLLYDLTSLQREANTRFGFSARRTLAAAQRCYEEHKVLTYPRTSSRYLTSDMSASSRPSRARSGAGASTPPPRPTCAGWTSCRSSASWTTRRSATTTRSSRRTPSTTSTSCPTTTAGSTTWWSAGSSRSSTRPRSSRTRGWRRRSRVSCSARAAGPHRAGLARGLRGAQRGGRRRRGGRGPQPAAAQARPGRGRRHEGGRVRGEGDQAAAALLGRVAARGDGDRGQARGRRRGRGGDEGVRASARPPRARRSSSASSTWATSSATGAPSWPRRRA